MQTQTSKDIYILCRDCESEWDFYSIEVLCVGTIDDIRTVTHPFILDKSDECIHKRFGNFDIFFEELMREGTVDIGKHSSSCLILEKCTQTSRFIAVSAAPGGGTEIEYLDAIDQFEPSDYINSEYSEYIGMCTIYDVALKKTVKEIRGKELSDLTG